MPLAFYKPNPSVKGCACSFSFNSKDGAVFLSLVKQTGWDNSSKTGAFKGGAQCNVKLNTNEIGGLIDTIATSIAPVYDISRLKVASTDLFDAEGEAKKPLPEINLYSSAVPREFNVYHAGQNQNLAIKFAPSYLKDKPNKEIKGIGLSVTQSIAEGAKTSFFIGFTAGECVVLKQYFQHALEKIFMAIYSEDKQKREESEAAKLLASGQAPAPKVSKRKPKAAPTVAAEDAALPEQPVVEEAPDPFAGVIEEVAEEPPVTNDTNSFSAPPECF